MKREQLKITQQLRTSVVLELAVDYERQQATIKIQDPGGASIQTDLSKEEVSALYENLGMANAEVVMGPPIPKVSPSR